MIIIELYSETHEKYLKYIDNDNIHLYVDIYRRDSVHITYILLPKVTLLDFFCNISGLAGIWVGLSLLDVIYKIASMFT